MSERRPFTITRMRVVDGYFEAYVTVNGNAPVHVDRRYGSWQADVRVAKGSREFARRELTIDVAKALQEKARSMERSIICPTCGAPAGTKCKDSLVSHRARVAALEEPEAEAEREGEAETNPFLAGATA